MSLQFKDTSTVEEQVQRFYIDIYRYCYFKTLNKDIAQDLAQDVFCHFFQRIDHYRSESKQKQILFSIAHNLCIDYYRKRKLYQFTDFDYEMQMDEQRTDIERNISIRKILNEVSDEVKDTLVLKYYYGFKIREIATITNTSISNVKYRLKKGLVELKTQVEKEGMTYDEWIS